MSVVVTTGEEDAEVPDEEVPVVAEEAPEDREVHEARTRTAATSAGVRESASPLRRVIAAKGT
ncbi:MAG: hypothetical protein ACXVWF_09585, partial [Actinomycetota bacterium]